MRRATNRRSSWLSIGLALALVMALVVAGVLLFLLRKAGDGGEVLLQPTTSEGPFPWTPSVVPADAPTNVPMPPAQPGTTHSPQAPSPTISNDHNGLTPVLGDSPELYGGSTRMSVCDKEILISFLENNPQKRAAWTGVLGVSDVRAYVESLTAVILTMDTRVTNHGFENGRATSLQSVLQAGTAVLIDDYGVPKVRCQCGNPLLPPVLAKAQPNYSGDRWAGFDDGKMSVILPPPAPITQITIIDVIANEPITIEIPATGGLVPMSSASDTAPATPARLEVDGTYSLAFTQSAGTCHTPDFDRDFGVSSGPPLTFTAETGAMTGTLAADNSFEVTDSGGYHIFRGVFVREGNSIVINGTDDVAVTSCHWTVTGRKH